MLINVMLSQDTHLSFQVVKVISTNHLNLTNGLVILATENIKALLLVSWANNILPLVTKVHHTPN